MSNLSWKSPFEMLYGKKPNYTTLRTIGYLCFAANVGERDKFEARAHQRIFVGYTFGSKSYELYDLKIKEFSIAGMSSLENIFLFLKGIQVILVFPV